MVSRLPFNLFSFFATFQMYMFMYSFIFRLIRSSSSSSSLSPSSSFLIFFLLWFVSSFFISFLLYFWGDGWDVMEGLYTIARHAARAIRFQRHALHCIWYFHSPLLTRWTGIKSRPNNKERSNSYLRFISLSLSLSLKLARLFYFFFFLIKYYY